MKNATISVVFDRKHVADNIMKKGLVQIRVAYAYKTMYLSTGVKVQRNQWDRSRCMVRGTMSACEMNEVINAMLGKIEGYRARCIAEGTVFSFDELRRHIEGGCDNNFLEFMRERIAGRGDLRESSRKAQMSAYSVLQEFGRIKYFSDLTVGNIKLFDDWLHGKGHMQTTIYGRHKVLKTYINEAVRFERVRLNPYSKVKLDKGKSRDGRFVRVEDMRRIMECELPETLEKVRDMAVVEFYTGLAFSDLMKFDFSNVTEIEGRKVVMDERVKTGERYYIVLFKPVLDVLGRYGGRIPQMSMQQYNARLKVVAQYAGLEYADRISSHWLRRGAGYWALNNGVSMEVVSKFLGHASIRQTESVYAKLLPRTVVAEMGRLEKL